MKDELKEITSVISIGSTFEEWDKGSASDIDLDGMTNPF